MIMTWVRPTFNDNYPPMWSSSADNYKRADRQK